jgi:hypothetical protein
MDAIASIATVSRNAVFMVISPYVQKIAFAENIAKVSLTFALFAVFGTNLLKKSAGRSTNTRPEAGIWLIAEPGGRFCACG